MHPRRPPLVLHVALANATAAAAAMAIPAHGGAMPAAANADFAPGDQGWVDVAWPGQFPHPQGMTQVVEPADLATMLANFDAARATAGANWGGITLYKGHPELDGSVASAAAYGWFKDARLANGRLQYRLELTALGQEAVAGRAFKFLSPYWYYTPDAAGNARPFWIQSVGLTNVPVIKDQKPLANADASTPWWQQFSASVASLIGPATDTNTALTAIEQRFADMRREHEQLEALRTLLCAQLGLQPCADSELMPAVAAACADARRLPQVEAAFRQFAVDRAQAEGRLAPAAVANATRLLVADRDAALAMIFAPAVLGTSAAPAGPGAPPASPLAGKQLTTTTRLANAGQERVPSAAQQQAITRAARAREAAAATDYASAHAWAWQEFQAGRLES